MRGRKNLFMKRNDHFERGSDPCLAIDADFPFQNFDKALGDRQT